MSQFWLSRTDIPMAQIAWFQLSPIALIPIVLICSNSHSPNPIAPKMKCPESNFPELLWFQLPWFHCPESPWFWLPWSTLILIAPILIALNPIFLILIVRSSYRIWMPLPAPALLEWPWMSSAKPECCWTSVSIYSSDQYGHKAWLLLN